MDSWVANLCGTKQLGGIVPSVRRRGRERERERERTGGGESANPRCLIIFRPAKVCAVSEGPSLSLSLRPRSGFAMNIMFTSCRTTSAVATCNLSGSAGDQIELSARGELLSK